MSADVDPFLNRLQAATTAHDIDAVVDCFADGYRNDRVGKCDNVAHCSVHDDPGPAVRHSEAAEDVPDQG